MPATKKLMIIKLKNGTATIKDVCTHKVKKGMNSILFKDATVGGDGKLVGVGPEKLEEANAFVFRSLVEKIEINGKDVPVTDENIDDLDEKDYTVILEAVDKLTGKEKKEAIPNA
jgi:hypothetical protein